MTDYLDPDAPLQMRIRNTVQGFAPGGTIGAGTDGCGAPNYALPLARLAHAFCRIACDDAPPLRALYFAMTLHPDLVSGTRRSDLALMQAGRSNGSGSADWVSKIGADGVQAIGVRSRGIGIAVRIADGNPRALHVATHEVLRQLGLLDEAAEHILAGGLADFAAPMIRNQRGVAVGTVAPVFTLGPVRI